MCGPVRRTDPGSTGCTDPDDEPLYVGKSVRVRTRLLSYFRAPRGEKSWDLIRETSRIEWDYIPNEFYALIREMKLIQRWQPRFNVQHKRRRIYAFVKVTHERAPRVGSGEPRRGGQCHLLRALSPRVRALADTVRQLVHVLGLRDCPATTPVFFNDQLEMFEAGRLPHCIRAEIRTCLAPCCGATSAAEYRAAVELARRFLEGRAEAPLAELERTMRSAAERLDFEYAAVLRDRLDRLTEPFVMSSWPSGAA